jgi:hypothetical protein
MGHPERSEWTSRFAGIAANLNKKESSVILSETESKSPA